MVIYSAIATRDRRQATDCSRINTCYVIDFNIYHVCSGRYPAHTCSFGRHYNCFRQHKKRPDLIQKYGLYMALITNGGPHDVSHVVSGFAWGDLGEDAVVIDVRLAKMSQSTLVFTCSIGRRSGRLRRYCSCPGICQPHCVCTR